MEELSENMYDENCAVDYILAGLREMSSVNYGRKSILEAIDSIFDFYEHKGLLGLDNLDADDSYDDAELLDYVSRSLHRKGVHCFTGNDDLRRIVRLEQDYEDSIM